MYDPYTVDSIQILWERGCAPYLLPTLPKHFGDFNPVGPAMFCLPFSFQSKLLHKKPPRSDQFWRLKNGSGQVPNSNRNKEPPQMPHNATSCKKAYDQTPILYSPPLLNPWPWRHLPYFIRRSAQSCWQFYDPVGEGHEICKPQAGKGRLKLALQILLYQIFPAQVGWMMTP